MRKTYALLGLLLVLTTVGSAATLNENAKTGTTTTAELDRPWHVTIKAFLYERFDGSFRFIADFWAWISNNLLMEKPSNESQVVG
jgi:FtsH-binding integral membrane protein